MVAATMDVPCGDHCHIHHNHTMTWWGGLRWSWCYTSIALCSGWRFLGQFIQSNYSFLQCLEIAFGWTSKQMCCHYGLACDGHDVAISNEMVAVNGVFGCWEASGTSGKPIMCFPSHWQKAQPTPPKANLAQPLAGVLCPCRLALPIPNTNHHGCHNLWWFCAPILTWRVIQKFQRLLNNQRHHPLQILICSCSVFIMGNKQGDHQAHQWQDTLTWEEGSHSRCGRADSGWTSKIGRVLGKWRGLCCA